MNRNWKYLTLVLVSLYLVSGFAAVTYADTFEDVFGSGRSEEKKMWDFSETNDIGGYLDVVSYSLGIKTIDFMMAFGVVFSALWMGLSMIGGMGGGFSSNDATKSAQMAFAAFAAIGTAFYVNMNDIPFTSIIAPYSLFLTVIVLALIMGNMIIKLKNGESDMGIILVAVGMSALIGGIGMNKFLADAGLGGVGAFIAIIGVIMLLIGAIIAIKDKYKTNEIKKGKAADKALEDAKVIKDDELKDEGLIQPEAGQASELQQAITQNNYQVASGMARAIYRENQDSMSILENQLKRVMNLINAEKYLKITEQKEARREAKEGDVAEEREDILLSREEEQEYEQAIQLRRLIEAQLKYSKDINNIFRHKRLFGHIYGLQKSLIYLEEQYKKIGLGGRRGKMIINPAKYPKYLNARARALVFVQDIERLVAELFKLDSQKKTLTVALFGEIQRTDQETKKDVKKKVGENKKKKKVKKEEKTIIAEFYELHELIAHDKQGKDVVNQVIIKNEKNEDVKLEQMMHWIREHENDTRPEFQIQMARYIVKYARQFITFEEQLNKETAWNAQWHTKAIVVARRIVRQANKVIGEEQQVEKLEKAVV
jgi:hypothetical protein